MSMIGNFLAATDEQVAALLAAPEGITAVLYPDDEREPERGLSVDKAWHGIHFLLNGEAWSGTEPLDFIVSGGEPVGEVDVGYGPARVFTSAQVRAIAGALAPLDSDWLMARWDGPAIRAAEVYAVDPDGAEIEASYLGGYFEELRDYVADLARDGLALIVYIN